MIPIIISTSPVRARFRDIQEHYDIMVPRMILFATINAAGYTITKKIDNSTHIWVVEVEDETAAVMFKLTYL